MLYFFTYFLLFSCRLYFATPTFSIKPDIIMALTNYRKIDISTQEGKRKIIDTFINAIFVYDDYIKIIYNGKNKEEYVTLEEIEGSTLFSSGAPTSYSTS